MTEATDSTTDSDDTLPLQEARLWRDGQWTARVIKNEDDDGWAVEMTKDGDLAFTAGNDDLLVQRRVQMLFVTPPHLVRRLDQRLECACVERLRPQDSGLPYSPDRWRCESRASR